MSDTRPVALIPAYKPEPVVVDIACALAASDRLQAVVVVNDGSGPESEALFASLASIAGVTILRHYVNLGKGAALKTGLNYIACQFPDSVGTITLDADGQHLVEDVLNVAGHLAKTSGPLVLGSREFDRGVPLRSRLGNTVTRGVMRVLGGLKLRDTQTGLRGIPPRLFPMLLRLNTAGYDFELDMLLKAKEQGVSIEEVPIQTVYIDENRSSHFNPFLDSLKIYMVFLRFNLSSLLAVVIDYFIFSLVYPVIGHILYSQFIARAFSGLLIFFVNRSFVFKSNQQIAKSMIMYFTTVFCFGVFSYWIILFILHYLSMPVILAKAIAEGGLYIFGFVLQREIIFRRKFDL